MDDDEFVFPVELLCLAKINYEQNNGKLYVFIVSVI